MKRDLKLNMSQLEAILLKTERHRKELEQVETASAAFLEAVKNQDSMAYERLSAQWESDVDKKESSLKEKLEIISKILREYISDMESYIKPNAPQEMMRVDRNDIWWNYTQIAQNTTNFWDILADEGSSFAGYKKWFVYNPFESEEANAERKASMEAEEAAERGRRERNHAKLSGFRSTLRTEMAGSLNEYVKGIQEIYLNRVIPFENTDDEYKKIMGAYYDEWATWKDVAADWLGTAKDIGCGIFDAGKDFLAGIGSLLKGAGELVLWAACLDLNLDELGLMPEFLEEDIAEMGKGLEALLTDPGNVLEAIGQGMFDKADEKGVAYSVSYVTTDIVIGILADKGLDKLKGMTKVDNVAGAADDIADITEEAGDAARAAERLGKTGDEMLDGVEDAAKHLDAVEKGRDILPNAENIRMSQTVQNHMNDVIKNGSNAGQLSRPYIHSDGTTLLLKEIMESANPVPDAILQSGLRWDVSGTFRGSTGTWELVVDTSTNTVVHFNFVAQ